MNKISIIVPCYNESENIELFYDEVKKVFKSIKKVSIEIIFVDDGSIDDTYKIIKLLHQKDRNVKCISFSKNFGKEAAIFSGLRASIGNCVIVIDADMQHPIDLIPKMYSLWQEGYEIVKGIKKDRKKEKSFNKLTSVVFNRIISIVLKINMNNSSDFNLLDRKVVDVLSSIEEYNTFYRALTYWVGYRTTKVYYDVKKRNASNTKWTFYERIKYSLNNIVQFTYIPLNLIIIIGLIITAIGIVVGIAVIISLIKNNIVSGYTTIALFLILSTGGIMTSLGIIGIYIAKIYDEVKKRPKYIIRDKLE